MAEGGAQQRQQAHRPLDLAADLGEVPAEVSGHRVGDRAGEGQAAVDDVGEPLLQRTRVHAPAAHLEPHPRDHRPHVVGDEVAQGAGGVGERRGGLREGSGPADVPQQTLDLQPHRLAVAEVQVEEAGIGGGHLGHRPQQHRAGGAGAAAVLGVEVVGGVQHGAQQAGGGVDALEIAAEPEQVRADRAGHRRVGGDARAPRRRLHGRAAGRLLVGDRGRVGDGDPHVLERLGALVGRARDPAGQHLEAVLGPHHQQAQRHRASRELLAARRVQRGPQRRGDVRGCGPQLQVLVQHLPAQVGQRRAQGRVLEQARAQRVQDLHVAAARRLDEARHPAQRRRPEVQGVQQRRGDQPQHRVDRLARGGGQARQAQGHGARTGAQVPDRHRRRAQQVRQPAVVEGGQRLLRVVEEHDGAPGAPVGPGALMEGRAQRVEEGVETAHLRAAVQRRRAAGENPPQLEGETRAAGDVHRVLVHHPGALGGAGDGGADGEEVMGAAGGDPHRRAQVGEVREQRGRRRDLGVEHGARSVQVRVQGVQQPHPLHEPRRQLRPGLRVQHDGHRIEGGGRGGDVCREHRRGARRRPPSTRGAEGGELLGQGLRMRDGHRDIVDTPPGRAVTAGPSGRPRRVAAGTLRRRRPPARPRRAGRRRSPGRGSPAGRTPRSRGRSASPS